MPDTARYPKRLIEVDLPIKRISARARLEKSIRQGHISTLHIWWARRPLASCRAVICAALWPDPGDPLTPDRFRDTARALMLRWASDNVGLMSVESYSRFGKIEKNPALLDDGAALRRALLDFIADFASPDNSTNPAYLETSRALTQAAHEALGGEPGTRPLVVDPFAGGGAIPLEALRVGADAFASDLNPVAVLLNKVVLEYIPKYGQRLAEEVRKWGQWVKEQAEKELADVYPKDPDGATPIAYIWARTIKCEGPGCGAEVPIMRSLWLAKKGGSVALRIVPDADKKYVGFQIIHDVKPRNVAEGTARKGSVTCPLCSYTTPVGSVRRQLSTRRGGTQDARLIAVVFTKTSEQGRFFRLPTSADAAACQRARAKLQSVASQSIPGLGITPVPNEPLPPQGTLGFRVQLYGMQTWADLFTPRQTLALAILSGCVRSAGERLGSKTGSDLAGAVQVCLALALDRQADHSNSGCTWNPSGPKLQHLFTRQAVPMVWDFAEANPFGDSVGDWLHAVDNVLIALESASYFGTPGQVQACSAVQHPLADDSALAFVTDPPYYDSVPYADLSDFFYSWLKRTVPQSLHSMFSSELTPKTGECIVDETKDKDKTFFENCMTEAMAEGRRVLAANGIGLVVFAHKSTSGWEAQLQAMISAGWTMTASWPIDTEMGTRLRAINSAALASSIHLVCRPRETPSGNLSLVTGDWRDVLAELPRRIHDWMPRLNQEGIVGADAIFACLGPALEIFSRYSSVEKASGEEVTLKEYLEQVWAAVSREALNMIFAGADATGFEADARLTAMWLWTLAAGVAAEAEGAGGDAEDEAAEDEEEAAAARPTAGGYTLEYDAARKIAQGLGAHLEKMGTLVQIKGDKARLLSVAERAKALVGQEAHAVSPTAKKAGVQLALWDTPEAQESHVAGWGEFGAPAPGETTLDRLHQAMLLFAAGRGEALKRFLVAQGAGGDPRFWRLADAFSALYPKQSDEKRWVDGVLARKKGLGF